MFNSKTKIYKFEQILFLKKLYSKNLYLNITQHIYYLFQYLLK